jgi:hypothetical protein
MSLHLVLGYIPTRMHLFQIRPGNYPRTLWLCTNSKEEIAQDLLSLLWRSFFGACCFFRGMLQLAKRPSFLAHVAENSSLFLYQIPGRVEFNNLSLV